MSAGIKVAPAQCFSVSQGFYRGIRIGWKLCVNMGAVHIHDRTHVQQLPVFTLNPNHHQQHSPIIVVTAARLSLLLCLSRGVTTRLGRPCVVESRGID